MDSLPRRMYLLTLASAFALALTACLDNSGGAGGLADGSGGTTGSVALLITDAPSADYDEILVTITGASLIPAGDGARVGIYSGDQTIDLLDLRDHSELFSLAEVPAGTYEKIRLDVSNIALNRLDDTGAVIATDNPKLPSGRIELNPRRGFEVTGGETLILQVDIDAQKSIHIVNAGNSGQIIFRPVVFVDIIDGLESRFTKVSGTIAEVDAGAGIFVLCGAFHYGSVGEGDERCLTVRTGDETAIFNADGAAGFDAIVAGDSATVIGRLRHYDGDGLGLEARFVWLGEDDALVRIKGVVTTVYDAENGLFGVEVARSTAFMTGDLIDAGIVDGARVLSRSGLDLGPEDIAAGLETRILGVLTGEEPEVRALVVFLADGEPQAVRLSGMIGTIDVDAGSFMLLPSEDGNIPADTLICTGTGTTFHIVSGMSSAAATIGELASGWIADVYGQENAALGCFDARNVIAFSPAESEPEPEPE